jgi:hypothetical protein
MILLLSCTPHYGDPKESKKKKKDISEQNKSLFMAGTLSGVAEGWI